MYIVHYTLYVFKLCSVWQLQGNLYYFKININIVPLKNPSQIKSLIIMRSEQQNILYCDSWK